MKKARDSEFGRQLISQKSPIPSRKTNACFRKRSGAKLEATVGLVYLKGNKVYNL